MPAPQAVLEQERRANELHAQAYGSQTGDGTPAQTQQPTPQGEQAAQPTNSPSQAPADPGSGAGHEEMARTYEELVPQYQALEQRLKTLQGKYRAEVPRLNEQVRTLSQQLQDAQQQAEQAAQQGGGEVSQDDVRRYLVEEYGEDGAEAFSKLVRQEIQRHHQQAPPQQPAGSNPEQVFWDELRAAHPDFDAVNLDPAFDHWLNNSTDPVTGMSLKYALNDAGRQFDHATVSAIVAQFKGRTGSGAGQGGPEEQVTPKHNNAPRTPEGPKQYTTRDYEALQREWTAGLWTGREAEFKALEQEIYNSLIAQQAQA